MIDVSNPRIAAAASVQQPRTTPTTVPLAGAGAAPGDVAADPAEDTDDLASSFDALLTEWVQPEPAGAPNAASPTIAHALAPPAATKPGETAANVPKLVQPVAGLLSDIDATQRGVMPEGYAARAITTPTASDLSSNLHAAALTTREVDFSAADVKPQALPIEIVPLANTMRDLEAVTVKAPVPQPATIAATVADLPASISAQVQAGRTEFRIRLDPADLGAIDVSLSFAEDGTLRTHLIVERPSTLYHLMQDAPRLEQALQTDRQQSNISFSLAQDQRRQPNGGWRGEAEQIAGPIPLQTGAGVPQRLSTHRLDLSV